VFFFQRCDNALLRHFGDLPIEQIDQQAIDRAATALYPNGSAGTRNRQVYTPVSAILKFAGVTRDVRRLKARGGRPLAHAAGSQEAHCRMFAAPSAARDVFALHRRPSRGGAILLASEVKALFALGATVRMARTKPTMPDRALPAENSHQPTRRREKFKSVGSAQRFLSVHAAAYNIFNVQRHLTSARAHPAFRASAMNMWHAAVAVS
jgi:hypothetical protein